MVKFTTEQAVVVAEIQQLINEWAYLELDINNGQNIGALITDDCVYATVAHMMKGRAEIEAFYRDRLTRLSQASPTLPVMRHLNANLCVDFRGTDAVSIMFCLAFFTTEGSGSIQPDLVAVADVRMECRREADGHWRIARNESSQPFRRG